MPLRLTEVQRIDKGQLTTQGFLLADAHFTRTGVFKYRKADGSVVRELRHPDDVFHPDSVASLQMAPLTNDHPKVFVKPENVKELSVGWVGEGVMQKDHLLSGKVCLADAAAMRDYQDGKKQLSCGYTADLVPETGTYDGEEYDVRQKNIRYNHVALVKTGRAGPQVRLLDSADEEIVDDANPTEVPKMKVKINGQEVEVTDEAGKLILAQQKADADVLEAAKKRADDAEKVLAETKKEVEAGKIKIDSQQAKIDHLETEKKERTDASSDDKIKEGVKERLRIEKVAAPVLGADAKLDEKDNMTLMKEVVLKKQPKADLKDKSDLYIQSRFDSIVEDMAAYEQRHEDLGKNFTKKDERKDSEFDAKAAREKSIADAKELSKQPLTVSKK